MFILQNKLTQKFVLYFFSVLLFYFFLLFFNINNKTLFIFYLLFFLYTWWFLKDFTTGLLLSFVTSLITPVGKYYFFELIPLSKLDLLSNSHSYEVVYFFNPSMMFGIVMFYIVLRSLPKIIKIAKKHKYIFFVFLIMLGKILSLYFSKKLGFSTLLLLSQFLPYILFLFLAISKKTRQKALFFIIMIIAAQLIFETFVVGFQFIKGGSFGSTIEYNTELFTFGKGKDESALFFRPNGTLDHPNTVAAFIAPYVVLIFCMLYLNIKKLSNLRIIITLSFFAGIIGLLITLSRSAWISVFIALVIATYFIEKKWKLRMSKITDRKQLILAFFIGVILFIFLVIPRMEQSVVTFTEGGKSGSLYVRKIQIQESLKLIINNPLGVGLGTSVLEMFNSDPKGITYYFPSPVHNWYLRETSEAGLLTIFGFVLMMLILVRKIVFKKTIFKNTQDKLIFLGFSSCIMVIVINGIMQAYPGDMSLFYLSLSYLFGKLDNY